MTLKITVLGSGTSTGIPRIDGEWGACDPTEPKNRRRRSSILVQSAATTVLIDTSPDIREQLLGARINHLDGVVWTHDHADQTHGIDDLRVLALVKRQPIDVWGDAFTLDRLKKKFGYCFAGSMGYPAIVRDHLIDGPYQPFAVGDLTFLPILQDHGTMPSLGFRIGGFAYSNDVVNLDDRAFAALDGVDTWLVDALRYKPHPTHAHLDRTLEWIARVKPRRAVLTNLHMDLDYQTLLGQIPPGVEPAYDGLVLDVA